MRYTHISATLDWSFATTLPSLPGQSGSAETKVDLYDGIVGVRGRVKLGDSAWFMPFYPGPGLGGHCIPVDPLYLSWTARLNGFEARFIELAAQVNGAMPHYVVSRIAEALNDRAKSLHGSRILILGVAYKRDVGDIRESPALEIISLLQGKKAQVAYHDPHVPWFLQHGQRLESLPLDAATLGEQDCVVIATDHSSLDYKWVAEHANCVVDTRNATKDANGYRHKVTKL